MLFQISRDEAVNKIRLDTEEQLKGKFYFIFKGVERKTSLLFF